MEDSIKKIWEKYPAALPEGSILAGQYIIQDVLGQGGFGITYLAEDYKLKMKVAVKEFFPESMIMRQGGVPQVTVYSDGKLENFHYGLQGFLDEARVLAQFQGNPNIVGVRSYFEENGTAYFVMDYIEGINLKTYIQRHGGNLGWEETCNIMLPIMDALIEVHRKGIIHRDVTPDNILIANEHTVKLLDFGAARYSLGDRSQSLDVVLKAGYAPKEQYTRRGKQGPYTDVYSVAACFYTALCGYLPPESLDRMDKDEIVSLSARGVQLPKSSEKAIIKGLEVRPENRFQSMDEFKHAVMGEVAPNPVPGIMEKLKQFLKKHRMAVTGATALVLIAIVIYRIGAVADEPVDNNYQVNGGMEENVLQNESAGNPVAYPNLVEVEESMEEQEGNAEEKDREEEKQWTGFFTALFDASCGNENDLEDYVTQGFVTEEELIDLDIVGVPEEVADSFMNGLLSDYNANDFPEEFAKIKDCFLEMISKAQYTVKSVEKQNDGSYIITVAYTQMHFFEPMKDAYRKYITVMYDYWQDDIESIFPEDEMEEAMLALLRMSMERVLKDIKYAKLNEKSIKIKKTEDGHFTDDEIDDINELFMNFFDLENCDGIGTAIYDDGLRFIGVWEKERIDCCGFIWLDGDIYVGKLEDGYPEGNGFYRWLDGDWYLGEFRNGERNGYGIYKFKDGSEYEGTWEDGELIE